jgi:two-component system response regulator HydG
MDELRNSTRERFIVISGNTSQRAAIKSIRHRAVEFVSKPVALRELKRIIGEAAAADSIDNESKSAEQDRSVSRLGDDTPDCWIKHGSSPALVELRTAISFSAEQRKGHALIVGEPGLEKRSVAIELHHRARRQGNIMFVDCKAITRKALNDELFGDDGNSYGRYTDEGGSIARAVGGTLVLDNVDSLSRELQSALSMFLDTGVYKRRGTEAGFKAVVAVVGIISDQGKVGSLRTDFTARLGQVTLNIPSLRECVRDIPTIAQWLLTQSTGYQPHYTFSDAMMSQLPKAPWSHNISEMRALIQASVDAMASSKDTDGQLQLPQAHQHSDWDPFNDLVGLTLRDFGDQLVAATLSDCQGDKAKTAKRLNISLKTLYNRLNSQ